MKDVVIIMTQATDTWQLLCTASTYVDDFHYGLDLQVSDEKTDKDNKFQKLLKEFFKKSMLMFFNKFSIL